MAHSRLGEPYLTIVRALRDLSIPRHMDPDKAGCRWQGKEPTWTEKARASLVLQNHRSRRATGSACSDDHGSGSRGHRGEEPIRPSGATRDPDDFRRRRRSDQASRRAGPLQSRESRKASGRLRHHRHRSQRPDHRAVAPKPDRDDAGVHARRRARAAGRVDRRTGLVMARPPHALHVRRLHPARDLQPAREAVDGSGGAAERYGQCAVLSGGRRAILRPGDRTAWPRRASPGNRSERGGG